MSMSSTKTPVKPSKAESSPVSSNKPVASGKEECPKIKYLLADFVEVVTQDEEKWVKGAAKDLTDTSVIEKSVERTDKDGDKFKQYINLEKNCEEQAKRHPEYGREIEFRARVKRGDGKKEDLSGVTVVFKCKWKKAANRASADNKIWSDAELTGGQKGGFGLLSAAETTTAQTDDKGWTPAVYFYTTQYGGDEFKITAELDPSVEAASRRPPMPTKTYVVWRKFWYQLTYGNYKYDGIKDYVPPSLQQAKDAYKEVFAEMVEATAEAPQKNVFENTDLPEDLRKRTFLEEFQVKQDGSDHIVAVIGGHNKTLFTEDEIYKKDKPKGTQPKANLIVCQYQCDPQAKWDPTSRTHSIHVPTALVAFDLKQDCLATFPGNEHRTGGPVVCKPSLWPNSDLVVKGEWYKTDGNKGGDIKDDCIEVYKGRPTTLTVKVDLTKATKDNPSHSPPVPTDGAPVKIKLQVETAAGYLGESFGDKQILCVYRPAAADKTSGCTEDFNNTVAHELGHMWNQTPRPDKKPDSLKDHPSQYVAHGGSGSHCRNNCQGGLAAGSGVYSRNVTTITSNGLGTAIGPDFYHKIKKPEGSKFINGHKVTVNGVEKTVKKKYTDALVFAPPNFSAAKDEIVVQTFTGLDKGQTETTITAAGANTKTHRVADSDNFVVGEKVKVGGHDRVVEAKPDKTHLKFTTAVTTAVNDKVVAQINWNNADQEFPAPVDGDCIMFHSFSENCSNKFCETCKPYLQLQEMT